MSKIHFNGLTLFKITQFGIKKDGKREILKINEQQNKYIWQFYCLIMENV